MGFIRGLDSGAIPIHRTQDLIATAMGGGELVPGRLYELIFGANLSPLEQIWDNVEERADELERYRKKTEESAEEFDRRGTVTIPDQRT